MDESIDGIKTEKVVLKSVHKEFIFSLCYGLFDKVYEEEFVKCLSDDELRYLNNTKNETKRNRFIFSRYLAKNAVYNLEKLYSPKNILIYKGILGQPILDGISNIQVSLSHSENLFIAMAYEEACPMAVDVEKITEKKINNIESVLTNYMIKEKTVNITENHCDNLIRWTAMESLSKVLKIGLESRLNIYSIKSIEEKDKYYISTFKNFPQFKCISFSKEGYIITFCFPKDILEFYKLD